MSCPLVMTLLSVAQCSIAKNKYFLDKDDISPINECGTHHPLSYFLLALFIPFVISLDSESGPFPTPAGSDSALYIWNNCTSV